MKLYIKSFSFLAAVILFFACKKVENKIYFEGGTKPALTASVTAINLQPGLEANTAIEFKWTNPDYKFTTGISSQDVNYLLQIDTVGGNFSSTKKFETIISKELVKSFTVGELNNIMGNTMLLQIQPRRNYSFEAHVIASIGDSKAVPLTSNNVTFTASPFSPPPKVTPPTTGTLYIVGDATPGGWPPLSNDPNIEKFTKISNTLYEITIQLNGGKSYKLVATPGQWTEQWSTATKNDPALVNGGNFVANGDDVLAPPTSGLYKITVNFQLGTFSVVKQ